MQSACAGRTSLHVLQSRLQTSQEAGAGIELNEPAASFVWQLAAAAVAFQAHAVYQLRTVLGSSHAAVDRMVYAPLAAGLPFGMAACMSRHVLAECEQAEQH